MRTILFLVACSMCFWFCNTKAELQRSNIRSNNTDTVNFKTQVQPVLEKKCSPCHFTGGKMYDKMPFDKGETISGHEAGILKRFKDKEQNQLIKAYIEQHAPGSNR